jgi:hypothetical protein
VNSLLMKHRPQGDDSKPMDPEKWRELWKNSHPQLQPLADVLKEWLAAEMPIRPSDFDCPNHYAKLVAQEARKQAFLDILDLLPDSVEK